MPTKKSKQTRNTSSLTSLIVTIFAIQMLCLAVIAMSWGSLGAVVFAPAAGIIFLILGLVNAPFEVEHSMKNEHNPNPQMRKLGMTLFWTNAAIILCAILTWAYYVYID